MTHKLNSYNDVDLGDIHQELQRVISQLESAYSHCMNLTENQYPEVYYLRGIFMNLKAIIGETDKGVQGGFIAQSYFDEKIDSLIRDLEGLVEVHAENVSTHFTTKITTIDAVDPDGTVTREYDRDAE